MKTYLGIDIGGTKIAGAAVTEAGDVFAFGERPTESRLGGPAVLKQALGLCDQLLAAHSDIAAIGIGAGGRIDPSTGVVVSATDVLPGWAGMNLKRAFAEAFRLPVAVDNDVNALALGETKFGAGKHLNTVVFLALGTGVGGALVIDGRIHHGAHFSGGEFGHILLSMNPAARADVGGAHGTLEAYCSGPGLVATWRDMGGDSVATGRRIGEEALRDASGMAAQAVARTGEYLGFGLVSLANALDPDMIVIGGGLSDLGDLLLDPARTILRRLALPGPAACPVAKTSLGGNASVVGAASLAMVDLR